MTTILTVEDSCTDSVMPKKLPLPEMPLFCPHRKIGSYLLSRLGNEMDFRDTVCSRKHAFISAKLLLVGRSLIYKTPVASDQ